MSQPPGWYPNPGGLGERWWDGEQWAAQARPPAPIGKGIKHRNSGPTLLQYVIISMIAVGTLISLIYEFHDTSTSSSKPAARRHVVYEVEGTAGSANITFQTATGGTSQQQDDAVPLTKAKDHSPGIEGDFPAGAFLYLSAQNPNDDNGTITCRITVDGAVVAQNTSSGSFTIATCSGSA